MEEFQVLSAPLYKSVEEILRKIKSRIQRKVGNDRIGKEQELANQWCRRQAVSLEQVLHRLDVSEPFSLLFKRDLIESEQRVKNSGVWMGGPGSIDLLYHYAERHNAISILETGVAYGWSSLALLMSLNQRGIGHLYSTNMHYPFRRGSKWVGCAVPQSLRKRWTLIKGPDRYGIPLALRALENIDLCHYDSDKSDEGKKWALQLIYQALIPHGVLIIDDAGDNLMTKKLCEIWGESPCIVEIPSNHGSKFVAIVIKSE